jgi:hypothetical protein
VQRLPTAAIGATGFIAGFAVAVISGSRALGGVVLGICGVVCIAIWLRRDGRQTATALTIAAVLAFALSHVLGLLIGAWPAVLLTTAGMAALCWRVSDSHADRITLRGVRPGLDLLVEDRQRQRAAVEHGSVEVREREA